ncbi:biliverdin-producing heme oxygenase [Sphingomonas sp. TZW2008]|uniref:biliverdin-producing heme oxygenase n=1 Tax=Sphingomonas sp. TZW2008 TaxID=1917973 RepID=UPI000A26D4EC|nr:biliverdin-producing heme oxygenase [Sphingomonas sp. TZW2008]
MSAIALLRSRTAAAHEMVDAAFGSHDLTDAGSYAAFLRAHARALPLAEARAAAVWPALRRRMPLLAADLAMLDTAPPLPASEAADVGTPAAWGALYVVEGSRLGGGMLAKMVGADLPQAYLGATHLPGEWRLIRQAIDAAAAHQDEVWHAAMVDGALDTFALYDAAARAERAPAS